MRSLLAAIRLRLKLGDRPWILGQMVGARRPLAGRDEPGETEGLLRPNLSGIVGRPIAAQPGFDYSPALRALARRRGRWNEALLDRFMSDPQGLVPGTGMAGYPGLDDPDQRRLIIEYLATR